MLSGEYLGRSDPPTVARSTQASISWFEYVRDRRHASAAPMDPTNETVVRARNAHVHVENEVSTTLKSSGFANRLEATKARKAASVASMTWALVSADWYQRITSS